jgi:cephalosporin hydroxylase
MDEIAAFQQEVQENIRRLGADRDLRDLSRIWLRDSLKGHYSYNFSWLGRPIIQYPQDIVALQELVWRVRPDLIIETGIAHGGSLILSASLLALLDYCDAEAEGKALDPRRPERRVLGVDIDIRAHNRAAIEAHPMARRISMIQGSSIAPEIVARVRAEAAKATRVLVCLDSCHSHDHVLAELEAYAPLVSPDSYCCVFDTVVEDLSKEFYLNRPWGPGNSPKTAVHAFLRLTESSEGRRAADGAPLRFDIDRAVADKLQITVAPDGFLKRRAAAAS